jgi:hypothetical protein
MDIDKIRESLKDLSFWKTEKSHERDELFVTLSHGKLKLIVHGWAEGSEIFIKVGEGISLRLSSEDEVGLYDLILQYEIDAAKLKNNLLAEKIEKEFFEGLTEALKNG